MKASILICTRNRAEHLRLTLASLENLCVPENFPTELIVIDNGSSDTTGQIVRGCQLPNMPVRYISQPITGQSQARNAGIAAARGDIILFTDDDLRFPPQWLIEMCRPILGGQTYAVCGSIKMAPHLERPWMTDLHRAWLAEIHSSEAKRPHLMVGANMAFSREVLNKVPAFDTELGPGALGFCDDLLFSFQLERAGYLILGSGAACVEHHFDESRLLREPMLERARKEGCSEAYLDHHWRHCNWKHLDLSLMKHLLQKKYLMLRRGHECRGTEGAPEWELLLEKKIHHNKQYRIEMRRPRNYEREGLIKQPSDSSVNEVHSTG